VRLGEALLKLRLVKERDIEEALARQFSFPCLQPGSNTGLSLELVAAYRPFSPEAEAFRSLRSRLLLHWFDEDRRTLAVVGPGRREGRSFVAANLAVAFAQMRIRTLLVDADLRRPRQDLVFNLPRHYGLSGVLGTPRNVNEVSGLPCLGDLHVVGAGAVPPNPLELLSREPFSKWLSRKAQQFQLVIIDTPAAALCTDTAVISAQSAGALMVARKDHTRLAEAQDLAEGLAVGGVPLAGTVLNHY
jgi:chain length determinant protein tyrosine kinase EpsG